MTLYDRSVDLQVKLEAALSADVSDELLNKARHVANSLDRSSEYLERVAAFRASAGISATPDQDQKSAAQAVRAFRAGLSSHGPAALQHQPATSLVEIAKAERDRAARWVKARWKEVFVDYEALLERERGGNLVGSVSQRLTAQGRASKLRAAQVMDPISEADQLSSLLGGADVSAWLTSIQERGAELREALRALDEAQDALTPDVRDALRRAASTVGLPLPELTEDLLSRLRDAGVDGHLVIRRV